MDPESISVPPLYLYVGNLAENTPPGDLWRLLFDNGVKGANDLHIMKKIGQKQYAIVTFEDAQSAIEAVPLVNKKVLRGKEIAVSIFVHGQHIMSEDGASYRQFIKRLRKLFARRKDGTLEYIDQGNDGKSPTNPVLGEQQRGKQPKRWIHIQLFANKDREESTTLVFRDDNLYVKGFTGKDGRWFELCEQRETEAEGLPEKEYRNPTQLTTWGFKYDNLMKLNDKDQVQETLKNMKLGKDFAARAVLRLSRYCPDDGVENENDDIPVRVGLAGLIVMISESARFNPILDHFADAARWDKGGGLDPKVADYIWKWKNMSDTLLKWRDSRARGKLLLNRQCTARSLQNAIECVQLVLQAEDKDLPGPHVEILGVSANIDVSDINVINVIDEHNLPQKIYAKKQGQANKELEQNVGEKGKDKAEDIEGCEWIDVKVKLPDYSGAGNDIVIEKRWDYCNEFQDGDATNKLVTGTIGLASDPIHLFTELELNVLDTGKSFVSSGFVMKFNVPDPERGGEDRVIERRWDCRKEEDGDATELVKRTIGLDGSGHKIVVTYLVMSKAIKAKVVVRLPARLGYYLDVKGDHKYIAYGKITAQIIGFEHHPIVLFRKAKEEAIRIERWLTLNLDRDVLQVPQGKGLQIDMKGLHVTEVESSRNRWPQITESFEPRELLVNSGVIKSFSFGESSPIPSNEDSDVEVEVDWKKSGKPSRAGQVLDFDMNDFAGSIKELRKTVAHRDHPDTEEDVLTEYTGTTDYAKDSHPVLARPREPPRWIHIKLQVSGEEKASTTIAVRGDNCCGFGFMNQSKVWYDLGNRVGAAKYNSVLLGWGVSSKDILGVKDWDEAVRQLESSVKLGKEFAEKAVRTLWRYPDVQKGDNPRLALAGLMLMVCESAKLNTVYRYFLERWDTAGTSTGGTQSCFSEQRLRMDHIRNWCDISRALLYWRDHGYCKWRDEYLPQETMEILSGRGADEALRIVHLVFNWQDLMDMEHDMKDKEGLTDFVRELRKKLADHVDHDLPAAFSAASRTDCPVLARFDIGLPVRWFLIGLPAGWFHIRLKLREQGKKDETSITLAIRNKDLCVVGFRYQKGTWYELDIYLNQSTNRILPAEYNSVLVPLDRYRYWDWSKRDIFTPGLSRSYGFTRI